MYSANDIEIRNFESILEKISIANGISKTKTKNLIASFRNELKISLELGYAVRLPGLVDLWPDIKGTALIYKAKPSSSLKRPKTVRLVSDLKNKSIEKISDVELLS